MRGMAFIEAPPDPGFEPGGIREQAYDQVMQRNRGRERPGERQRRYRDECDDYEGQ